jgi:hygromycin-B 7''-O-kinase
MSAIPTLLPSAETLTAVSVIRKNQPLFEPGLRHILHLAGLPPAATITGTLGGSLPVFGVNHDLVVKLFSPLHREHFANELASLRLLEGKTPFGTPRIRTFGTLETWSYLLMTRVRGTQLSTLWPDLNETKKAAVCENLGATAAALHRVHATTPADAAQWRAFTAGQAGHCVEHHRARGLGENLLAQIPAYIAPMLAPMAATPVVFLHTEFMLEHIFIDPVRLTIEGLIDFEPSMTGPAEYEFGAVAIFVAEARPARLRAFLRGYGYPWTDTTARLLLSHKILHRYSNLIWYMERLGPARAETLEDLEKAWFSIDPA